MFELGPAGRVGVCHKHEHTVISRTHSDSWRCEKEIGHIRGTVD